MFDFGITKFSVSTFALDELAVLDNSSAHSIAVNETPAQAEIREFFVETVLQSTIVDPLTKAVRQFNPLEWWRQNNTRFPLLSVLAAKYMAVPPTSVASERLFSTAGDVLTDSRSRLLPQKAEQLIFLKINLPLVH